MAPLAAVACALVVESNCLKDVNLFFFCSALLTETFAVAVFVPSIEADSCCCCDDCTTCVIVKKIQFK